MSNKPSSWICVSVRPCMYVHVCVRACTRVCVYVYVCVYVCMYMYVYNVDYFVSMSCYLLIRLSF